jgi:hypothetical protein
MDSNEACHPKRAALSVLGDRFDIQLAVEISGLTRVELLHALDIAQRRRPRRC